MLKYVDSVPFDDARVALLSDVAYGARLTLNCGYTSRHSPENIAYAQDWPNTLAQAKLAPDTVYVASLEARSMFTQQLGARCGVIESLLVCVRADRRTPFSDYLDAHPTSDEKSEQN